MRRRPFLAAVAGVGLAGCVSDTDGPAVSGSPTGEPTGSDPSSTGSSGNPKDTPTAVRKTDDGVAAIFRVVDSHAPTDDSVDATFDGHDVTVTGSMDPEGCNEPTLDSVGYAAAAGRVDLVVGEVNPYGETATVECANASYDFRSVVTVKEGAPSVVVVTYDHPTHDDRTYTVERD